MRERERDVTLFVLITERQESPR
uniref:Uncharacterized protein n=1 Tax=Arundo donax TaxID=35708 RepID=A0A0A9GRI4_ARUDO